MQTILQLQQLSLNEQAQYIWDHGTFVESKTELDMSLSLYWMDTFYAEVIYDNAANTIVEVVFKEAFYNN
jgi:hypothetical protein